MNDKQLQLYEVVPTNSRGVGYYGRICVSGVDVWVASATRGTAMVGH
jgi:hypothetical protein